MMEHGFYWIHVWLQPRLLMWHLSFCSLSYAFLHLQSFSRAKLFFLAVKKNPKIKCTYGTQSETMVAGWIVPIELCWDLLLSLLLCDEEEIVSVFGAWWIHPSKTRDHWKNRISSENAPWFGSPFLFSLSFQYPATVYNYFLYLFFLFLHIHFSPSWSVCLILFCSNAHSLFLSLPFSLSLSHSPWLLTLDPSRPSHNPL